MDFVLTAGSSTEEIEETMFKWAVNQCAKVERLREFCGLENAEFMRMVATAAEFCGSKPARRYFTRVVGG